MGGTVVALACTLLCLLGGGLVRACIPTEYTLYVERPGCDYCVAVNTTICMGLCYSRDSNIVGLVGKRLLLQRGCTYRAVEQRTVLLPGCGAGADPLFSYPAALLCHCSTCDTGSHECTHRAAGGDASPCTKPLTYATPLLPLAAETAW